MNDHRDGSKRHYLPNIKLANEQLHTYCFRLGRVFKSFSIRAFKP